MTKKADIKYFWSLVHAWQSFRLARDAHSLVVQALQNPPPDGAILKSAVTTLYIAYARPFKASHGVPSLPESVVPDQYVDLHKLIIGYRDQAIAHKDKTPTPIPDSVNHVAVVLSSGKCGVCPVIHFPSLAELQGVPSLCDSLIEWVEERMSVFYHEHMEQLDLPQGNYLVEPNGYPNEWIRQIG